MVQFVFQQNLLLRSVIAFWVRPKHSGVIHFLYCSDSAVAQCCCWGQHRQLFPGCDCPQLEHFPTSITNTRLVSLFVTLQFSSTSRCSITRSGFWEPQHRHCWSERFGEDWAHLCPFGCSAVKPSSSSILWQACDVASGLEVIVLRRLPSSSPSHTHTLTVINGCHLLCPSETI